MIDLSTPAPISEPLIASHSRDLTAEDLALAKMSKQPTRTGEGTSCELLELRQGHHRIAKLLSTGMKSVEVAAVTGYSQSRISVLKTNPAFRDLMTHYENVEEARFSDIRAMLADLSTDALALMRERIESDPEAVSMSMLKSIAEMGLDRTGHGTQTRTENVHAVFSKEDLDAIRQHSGESRVYRKDTGGSEGRRASIRDQRGEGSVFSAQRADDNEPIEGEIV